ncbi:alpha/beta hydrolase [Kribbella sp.]|uniref:alpha/beta hydrolase n=1 Tax=Kribbella sp. TaxID=1871183 RepID=UPI002D356372|nr:alpha/beta hydrolase fold domain-containing protein [Kribbella sp.]HZX04831.1 alpha/beta hydrolase fold domain-containing protein [Kribbella sp.]
MRIVDNLQLGPETDALLKHLADVPAAPGLDPYEALLLDREDLPDPAIAGEPDPRVATEDVSVELPGRTLQARVYRYSIRPRPVLLWLHGGGFVGGDLRDIEYATSRIAADGNVTVVSLNYRLAPENPCPAALQDVYETLGWIREHLDGDGRIAIGGQSAGGALAAGACLLARDAGTPLPDRQVLCYPVLDLHPSADWHEWYFGSREIPAGAVPLQAASLAGLPPTLMLAAGRDWLRDDALAYAARLERDGVPTELVEYADTMHAFLNFPAALSAGRHAVELIAADLKAAFSARRS